MIYGVILIILGLKDFSQKMVNCVKISHFLLDLVSKEFLANFNDTIDTTNDTSNNVLSLFVLGRRVCMGETFTRYNMFGIIAVLMQNFNFSFIEDEPNSLKDKMPGLIISPKEMWIRVEPRYT